MTYEKPTVVTITAEELEQASMNAFLQVEPDNSGDPCKCQCQCQCQAQ
jgi:hypothetical protein